MLNSAFSFILYLWIRIRNPEPDSGFRSTSLLNAYSYCNLFLGTRDGSIAPALEPAGIQIRDHHHHKLDQNPPGRGSTGDIIINYIIYRDIWSPLGGIHQRTLEISKQCSCFYEPLSPFVRPSYVP